MAKPTADLNAFVENLANEDTSERTFAHSFEGSSNSVVRHLSRRSYDIELKQVKKINLAAARKGCSKSEIVRAALDQYFNEASK